MPNPLQSLRFARFEGFQLDLSAGELRKGTERTRLQEKPLQMLRLLLEHSGEVVTREELQRTLWPGGTVVEFDHSIATALKKLRRALGDDADHPGYIETLARRGYRWIAGVEWVDASRQRGPAHPSDETIDSIAVLPFANLSGDAEQDYFSDGLAEEILNLLTKIAGLKVIARTSSFAFRGEKQDIAKIAQTLRVRTILEGSVRRAGNRIRVTAQLIDAQNACHLWSERYDRDLTDIFAVQDEIGQAISEALQVRLVPRPRTVDIEAYQNFLRGQYHYLRLTPESLAKAKDFFEQSLSIDPNYAPAYSGLAEYYFYVSGLGLKPVGEMAPLAKSAAEKALAIDPANSVAYSVLGAMAAVFDFDWQMAETHFRKALMTEPVPTMVRLRYAVNYLVSARRIPDAMEQIRLALETDPLSMPLHLCMALCMYFAKQYAETIEYARRALEIDSNYYLIWNAMGLAQLGAGFTQEAITSLKRVAELAPWFSDGGWYLAAAYHQAGDYENSQEWARKLASSYGRTYGPAIYYAASGNGDAMFESLEGAYRHRDMDLPFVQGQALFDPWHADRRFQSLLQRMNLEPSCGAGNSARSRPSGRLDPLEGGSAG